MTHTRSDFVHSLLLGTTCLAGFAIAWPAYAGGPSGATVVSGSATVSNPNSSTTVINQKSEKTLINWQDFSIPKGDTVTFSQPNSSAIALNRVTGPNASTIYGDLMANGNVWLINGNGILFGKGSRINVGSLIATTSDISNQDFANGNYNFSKASANPNASVVNQGSITTAKGGSAILSAPSVSNSGIIQADVGNVVLGGVPAFSVDFDGDNLLRYAVIAPSPQTAAGAPAKASVSNTGTISANGGTVLMTAHAATSVTDAVVNNTGIVEATSVSAHDGEIILDAGDGTANAGGTLDASGTGAGQTGGTVSITGKQVNVGDGAKIDASGNAGGGTILIGGGFHGAGTIANAQTTTVGRATITADAVASGNGGKVAIWSSQNTQFAGAISAKGGAAGGNGGYVETSGGQLHIVDGATVVTSAPKGTTGTWLLDPTNIIIGPGPRGGTSTLDNGVLSLTTDPGATDTITTQAITAALQGGTDVTLEASNDITVKDDLIYSATNTLSLLAEHDIDVLANVQNSGSGAVNLIAGWDGTTLPGSSLTASGVFGNNGGKVVIGGAAATGEVAIGSASGVTTIAAASLLVEADKGYAQLGFHGAGGGAIDVFTTGNTALTAGSTGSDYAQIGNGAVQGAPSGNVSGDIALQLGGTLTLAGQTANGGGKVWLGNVAASGSSETGNVTLVAQNITSSGGASLNNIIAADLGNGASGGNVTIGLRSTAADVIGGLFYSSSNALTLLSGGNVDVESSIQNSGTGNLNIVAGWDGVTLDPASLTNAGVFGNNTHGITIGGTNAASNVAVGNAGGTTTLAGDGVTLSADNGFAQIGFRGAGGGNIDVVSSGNVALAGGAKPGDYAQIGNGAVTGAVNGTVTGDVSVTAGGTFSIAASAGGGRAWLGNFAPSNSTETGNVTLVAKDENNNGDAIDDLASIIGRDIVGGDVLIGLTDAKNTLTLGKNVTYNSPYTLSLLDAGNIVFTGSLQNSGSGALNFIAGWDGFTLDPASLTQGGVYGNNGGSIRIGGSSASGNVAVGSVGGLTTLAASDLTLTATNGYAQLGYHGAGGGDINVLLNGALNLTGGQGSNDFAQIGNGDLTGRTQGNVTSNIAVNVAGASQFSAGNSDGGGVAWLGNSAAQGSTESGDVNFTAQTLTLSNEDAGQFLGNDLTGGNVSLALTGADSALTLASTIDVTSPYALTILVGGNITFDASVQNAGGGAITVLAGWDGFTLDPSQFSNPGVFGNNNASLTIGGNAAFGDVALGGNGSVLVESNTISLDAVNGYAQIGYHGAGGGAVTVASLGDITLTGGGATNDFAQIGNGSLNMDVDGPVSGSTTVTAGGAIALNANTDGGGATAIANSGTSGSGDVTIFANGVIGDIGTSLAAGLPLGDFFLASNGTDTLTIATAANYNNGNTLTLLNGGDIVFDASVQNAGSGSITVLAGWDGFTLDPSQFTNFGVFGNNNANLTIGGSAASSDVALGGNGTLLVESNTINLDAANGYAQIGYHGAGGGAVTVTSLSDITLTGGGQTTDFAQIGNGSLNMDIDDAVSGSTNVTAGGAIALNANTDGGGATGIANSGTSGSGDVNIRANGVTGDIGTSLAAGLPLGNFQLASTGTDTLTIATAANYNNDNTLTLLNGGDIVFDASVQNAGDGNITVLAGWDGFTLDSSQFTNAGVFGNNNANLTIGGNAAFGDVALGGNGSVLVESNTIDLDAANGYAQIGYHGAGGGAVTVTSLGDITLTGGGQTTDFAQIGNGSLDMDVGGAVSGSTNVTAGGTIALNANTDGGGATGIANSGTSGSGDVNIFANGVTGDIGTSLAAGLPLGNFQLASTGTDTLTIATAANYNNGNTLTLLNGGDIVFDASVQNAGSGNITVLAGWDGFTLDPSQFSNPGVFGNNNANLTIGGVNAAGAVSVGTNSGQTLIEGGNITVDAEANNAQIGYAGNGSGNIDVFASGNILVEASDSSAQIGNGISGGSGNVSGDILVNAGGDLTLSGASLIGNQTGAEITESGNVAIASQTFGGDIDPSLTNDLPGGNFSLAVAGNSPLTIDAALNYNSGNTLSLSTGGDLTVEQSIQNAGFGAINLASGGTLTIGGTGASGDVAVGSAQGTTTILAGNLSLDAENGYAQLGYHGAGGGDIFATIGNNLTLTGGSSGADTAQIGNGSLMNDIDGAATGNIFVQAGGTSAFNAAADGGTVFFGNASGSGETGNVTLISGSLTNVNVDILANLFANVAGGDVVTQLTNESTPLMLSSAVDYNSAHSLTFTTSGDLVLAASFENSGSGAITLSGANITLGGDGAAGNVNVGSAGGLTTLTGNSLTLDASQGYAQLGTPAGSGSINVSVTGDLALIGGSGDGQYAQIGNGGLLTTGNNSGAISVAAGGNVSLNGGTGKESYAQIGHGGAESNSSSGGYSNVGTITVSGAKIALNSGSGTAAYSQIGNGGFEAGNLLAGGTATNSGDITVSSSQSVTLLSNGQDAYAQIGNGGDQVNLGASASAHGVISGTINVSAPNGSGAVTLTAGSGQNAYTQIGNGGYADNKSDTALAANFSDTGSVTVSDLSLNGGDVGSNGYAQIGNGDASGNTISNVSGDVTLIANGQVTTIDGTAPDSPATIGNATGSGTVTGTVTGLPVIPPPPPPPPVGSDPQTIGVIASLTATSSTPTSDNNVVVVTPEETVEASTQPAGQTNPAATSSSASSPIAAMSGGEGETATASDTATASIGQSLSPGGAKPGAPVATRTLIAGVLHQVVPGAATRTPHGVPPANQDFSSWGNEALWLW